MRMELKMLSVLILCVLTVGCGAFDKNPVAPSLETGILGDSTVASAPVQKPGSNPNAVAPTLPGYQMRKASIIYKFWDSAGRDWDYLIRFDIPVSSLPSSRRVWAMAWYGTWYDETSQVQLYEYGSNGNGTYRLQYVFGKGKAWAYGIYMHPNNWALYYR